MDAFVEGILLLRHYIGELSLLLSKHLLVLNHELLDTLSDRLVKGLGKSLHSDSRTGT